MTQPRSHPSAGGRRTGDPIRRILLLAMLAMGCDDDATGARARAPAPPADDMRLLNMTMTDSAWGGNTRHHFIYDAAGRLKQVDFYVSAVANGPPVRRTVYTEHVYAGDVLTRTDGYALTAAGSYAHLGSIDYTYDRLGYMTRETVRRPRTGVAPAVVDTFAYTYRYDRQGRLVEYREPDDEPTFYRYNPDGTLAAAESRYLGGGTLHETFQYSGGRNPFYLRRAHFNSLQLPIVSEALLLAPANLARLENRGDDDPTLVSSLTNEYEYDPVGRPLRIRQTLRNDNFPDPIPIVLLIHFEYEPATGA